MNRYGREGQACARGCMDRRKFLHWWWWGVLNFVGDFFLAHEGGKGDASVGCGRMNFVGLF